MNLLPLFAHASEHHHVHNADSAVAAGAIAFLLLFSLIVIVASYIVYAWALGGIFKKAGVESWKAWVPVYNNWVLLELGGQPGYWAVLAFVPIVNIAAMVFMFIAMYHIGLKLGKDGAFVILAIFLPLVWLIWLALDSSKWHGKKPANSTSAG